MKEPKFKVGESVYVNKTGFIGTIICAYLNKNDAYYVKTRSSAGYYYYSEHELKPIAEGRKQNIPIRNIKSLVKKSKVCPSANNAEKRAIDLYIHMAHSMSEKYTTSKYEITDLDVETFTSQMKHLEKMAIEFYKTIKP